MVPEAPPLTKFSYEEPHMATPVRIKFYAASGEVALRAKREAYAEIARIDQDMNDYKPESEISLLSARSGQGPAPVSERLFDVLEASQKYSELSGGAFDITVGPVVALWRRARQEKKLPERSAIESALGHVGYKKMVLDPVARTANLLVAGMKLDVGGIAKGYACDRALAILRRHGITRALVDTGGGMAFGDPPPGEAGWRIRMADTSSVLVLSRCGIATSGDWERFVEVDGKRYSHVVDPATGIGLTRRELVTVVAPTGIEADALTKVVMVPGPERGLRLIERLNSVNAWMRWQEPDGSVRTAESPGFRSIPSVPLEPE